MADTDIQTPEPATTPTPIVDGPLETDEQAAEAFGRLLRPEPQAEPTDEQDAAPVEAEAEDAKPEAEITTDEVEVTAETGETGDDGGEDGSEAQPELIAAPASWPEADKAAFAELPPETQRTLATRESAREADFTRKSQDVANRRRAADEDMSNAQLERQHYTAQVFPLIEQMAAALQVEEQGLAELLDDDPDEYVRAKVRFDANQGMVQSLLAEHHGMQQRQAEAQANELHTHQTAFLQQQVPKLLEAIPEWADPVKRESGRTELVGYLQRTGFSDQEIGSVVDSRHVVMARKAMLYDKLQDQKTKVAKKVKGKPPAKLKPGTPQPKGRKADERMAASLNNLRNNPNSTDAAASALGTFLNN